MIDWSKEGNSLEEIFTRFYSPPPPKIGDYMYRGLQSFSYTSEEQYEFSCQDFVKQAGVLFLKCNTKDELFKAKALVEAIAEKNGVDTFKYSYDASYQKAFEHFYEMTEGEVLNYYVEKKEKSDFSESERKEMLNKLSEESAGTIQTDANYFLSNQDHNLPANTPRAEQIKPNNRNSLCEWLFMLSPKQHWNKELKNNMLANLLYDLLKWGFFSAVTFILGLAFIKPFRIWVFDSIKSILHFFGLQ